MAILPFFVAFLSLQSALAAPKVASSWFGGWHNDMGFAVSNISWTKYTDVIYAFAETTPDPSKIDLSGSEPEAIPQFVSQAHKNGVKARIAIGGWTGSRYFSDNLANSTSRAKFLKAVIDLVKKYNFDGVNIDWEYPNSAGIGCNTIRPQDTANFLSFLQLLRKDPVGKKLIVSSATAISPFADENGDPSADVSGFAKVLDYIEIMNYDINGPWSATVGPNAPLADACAPEAAQQGSATTAIAAWHDAGFPYSQIVLGVPAYGHSFRVRKANAFVKNSSSKLALYPAFDADDQPAGDSWDDGAGTDECGNATGQGGNIDFWGMVKLGFLCSKGKPKAGIAFLRDSCSQTPYVYNPKTEVMVSYDDAESFAAKGKFITKHGLRGFAMWETGGDLNDILLNSIRKSIGL